MTTEAPAYDAVLIIAFGGPEGTDDVIPFLENVLQGRNVPRARMLEVAEHYSRFGGVSPINGQVRGLIRVLGPAMRESGIDLPIYWGNRNWHPFLSNTVQQMADDGVRRALAVVLSAYSSYSGCRQYLEDIARARSDVDNAPVIDKARVFFNHPDFIAANAERLQEATGQLPADHRSTFRVAFTAHSLPTAMADACDYVAQLTQTCRMVTEKCGLSERSWSLVFQSRSGRPSDPWLEPDICDHIAEIAAETRALIIMPIGFLSDHVEVLFDLDCEAKQACQEHRITMVRAATVGCHPLFVQSLTDLIHERATATEVRRIAGTLPARPDSCPIDCCPDPQSLKKVLTEGDSCLRSPRPDEDAERLSDD